MSPSNAPNAGAAALGGAEPPGGGGGGAIGAPEFGIGGGGGAAIPGIGGGGGALLLGIGGGGGGAAGASNVLSVNDPGIGGAAGGATGDVTESCTGVCGLLSMADNGRGGAIVPNSREASCFADPPVGASSLSLSSLSDPASDQSSSSFLRLEIGPAGLAASC